MKLQYLQANSGVVPNYAVNFAAQISSMSLGAKRIPVQGEVGIVRPEM
jgi:hypothetical protein